MSEILDPGEIRSFLTQAEIYAIAESLAFNPSIQACLSEDRIEENFAKYTELTSTNGIEHSAKTIIASLELSGVCIYPILRDQNGRSANHIAGEVCRVAQALKSVIYLEKIPELQYFYDLGCKRTTRASTWYPEGTIFPCPTIDEGEDEAKQVRTMHGIILNPRVHSTWQGVFVDTMLPTHGSGQDRGIKPIQAPFVLNTGGVVAYDTPAFYQLADGGKVKEEPRPLELVGV